MQVSRVAGYGRDDPSSLTGTTLTTDELAASGPAIRQDRMRKSGPSPLFLLRRERYCIHGICHGRRFAVFCFRMSLLQNRCTPLRDML